MEGSSPVGRSPSSSVSSVDLADGMCGQSWPVEKAWDEVEGECAFLFFLVFLVLLFLLFLVLLFFFVSLLFPSLVCRGGGFGGEGACGGGGGASDAR